MINFSKNKEKMKQDFWEKRWKNEKTGWDLGIVSPPIKEYINQLTDKSIRILIPGCGNAHEAEYLWENGFKNTFIVEFSKSAIDSFKKRYSAFPDAHIFHQDFFHLQEQFDLVIEQTFFCAIHPSRRTEYAKQMNQILNPNGKIMGLLFYFPLDAGPPFGGSKKEYLEYFTPYFDIQIMENAHNSVKPRLGREYFFLMRKI